MFTIDDLMDPLEENGIVHEELLVEGINRFPDYRIGEGLMSIEASYFGRLKNGRLITTQKYRKTFSYCNPDEQDQMAEQILASKGDIISISYNPKLHISSFKVGLDDDDPRIRRASP